MRFGNEAQGFRAEPPAAGMARMNKPSKSATALACLCEPMWVDSSEIDPARTSYGAARRRPPRASATAGPPLALPQ